MEGRRGGLIGEAIKQAKQARKATLSSLQGLTAEQLLWRPAADANSIQWILWHLGEVEESVLWAARGEAARWRFDRSALKARGAEQGLPSREDLVAYLGEVRDRYLGWLQGVQDDELDHTVGEGPWQGTVGGLIFLGPRHESYHCGQVSYIRRLMGAPVPDRNESNPYQ